MMLFRPLLAVAILLSVGACSRDGEGQKQDPAKPQRKHWWSREPGLVKLPGAITDLEGLYQGEGIGPTHQMCVVKTKSGGQHFAIIIRGLGPGLCSGSGTIGRNGGGVRLVMAGESPCTIDAAVAGRTLTLPAHVPQGCSYYCGAGGKFDGARLVQTGTTRKDALSARDAVGDSLCVAEEG